MRSSSGISRDQALVLLIAFVYVAINVTADVITIIVSPRARTSLKVSSLLDTTTASVSTGDGSLLSGDASTVYKDVAATGGWPVLRGALKLRRTQVGLSLVGLIVLIALFGPFVAPHSPTAFVAPPYWGPPLRPHSAPTRWGATC